ncbi:hypothetical protein EKO27_g6678 [Xylaria grammica]|uniref:Thioester reductase (TE) domain-containing protein n=1 Tax=Xylaria grammica TaxID=363999 RepID=A0A439D223_9PEZI|nr:hypothetical protein EKO27_g6678 [Xylaria grammica]
MALCSDPQVGDVQDGFRDITAADVARCVNFMALWIEQKLGRSSSFETVSFIGVPDLRGAVIFQALVKCGYKLLLPSPRNPPSINVSLMGQTNCATLLYTPEVGPLVRPLQELKSDLRTEAVPSFDEMMGSVPAEFPYSKSFDEAYNDPVVVLHSSGSTGIPKPITMTHGSFAVLDNEHNLPDIPGRKNRDWSMWTFKGEAPGKRQNSRLTEISSTARRLPVSYCANNFHECITRARPPALGTRRGAPQSVMTHQKLRSMFLPPAIVEQLLHEPNGIDFFKNLDFLVCSGAPFNPVIGDQLSEVVELISPFGSTEVYPQPELAPIATKDWGYHEFNPHVKHEMRPFGTETFELVILVDESTKQTAATYHNIPGVAEYQTKDLFVRHPEKANLYKYYGRKDDIIVLANGEKFNPIPLELNVQNEPSLKGALLVGNRRTRAALLVESKERLDEIGRRELLEKLWPLVEKSNLLVPGQGRVQKTMLICASSDKPFVRTGKGTIVRKLTEEAYNEEIDRLYSQQPGDGFKVSLKPTAPEPNAKPIYERDAIAKFIREIVTWSFPEAANMQDHDDFAAHGLDSEQTVLIVSSLKRNLREISPKSIDWITPRTIFRHSTVESLGELVSKLINDGVVPDEFIDLSRSRAIEEAVVEYSKGLPERSNANSTSTHASGPSELTTAALVGSTGYLGLYLTATLLRDSNISHIVCLNRARDAAKRQEADLLKLDQSLRSVFGKLSYITVNFDQPLLGLTSDSYQRLATEVDVLIFNAWQSNFALPLRAFHPFLSATREIANLAAHSHRNMRILFVSTIGAIGSIAQESVAPESLVEAPLAALNSGYAESKLVAERILAIANRQAGIPVSIARVGQIGGLAERHAGEWADQAWLSSIARTAKTLGCLPSQVASVDWIPVDSLAKILHGFAVNSEPQALQFYNVCHPRPQPWDVFLRVLRKRLGVQSVVPLRDWVKLLRDIGNQDTIDMGRMPAVKLLNYYETLGDGTEGARYATDQAFKRVNFPIPELEESLLERWLTGWSM